MKKTTLLNQPLSTAIAGMGHTDTIVIADAGLPIPATTTRIDLAVSANVPSFLDVLKAVLAEMQVESATLAEEIKLRNPAVHAEILTLLAGVPIHYVTHEAFKAQTRSAVAVARTGECSPYANIILSSGVVF